MAEEEEGAAAVVNNSTLLLLETMKNYKEEDGNYHLLSETINILNGLTVIELSFSTPPPPPPYLSSPRQKRPLQGFLGACFLECMSVCV